MFAIITLLAVIAVSLIVTRVASVALMLTGLSSESARFQARSAFTGSGFTTSESEAVVNHPVRRRIILMLMLLGNAGLVSGAATLLLGFLHVSGAGQGLRRAGILLGGLAVLVLLSRSTVVHRAISRVIERALRRFTRLDTRDYAALLHLAGEWRVGELAIEPQDWLAERPLSDLKLPDEGVVVLGVQRLGHAYLGAPTGGTCLRPGDSVLLYGREQILADLDVRRRDTSGERAKRHARAKHQAELVEQAEQQQREQQHV